MEKGSKKANKPLILIVSVIIACIVGLVSIVLMTVVFNVFDTNNQSKQKVREAFSCYENTNDTYLEFNGYFQFSNSNVSLDNLGFGEVYPDAYFVYNDSIYFVYSEGKWFESNEHYRVMLCDFYGKNAREVYSFDKRILSIDCFDNAFYFCDGNEIEIYSVVDGKSSYVKTSLNADDYVEQLIENNSLNRYSFENKSKTEILIKDNLNPKEYFVNKETLKNTAEGITLSNFDYELDYSYSQGRLLITAIITCDGVYSDSPLVIFEYDSINNKLLFQNYFETSADDLVKAYSCKY